MIDGDLYVETGDPGNWNWVTDRHICPGCKLDIDRGGERVIEVSTGPSDDYELTPAVRYHPECFRDAACASWAVIEREWRSR